MATSLAPEERARFWSLLAFHVKHRQEGSALVFHVEPSDRASICPPS